MDNVEDNGNALAVGSIDEFLELFGSAEARRGCEEVGHLVAERAVIGMLLHGHQLYHIIAEFFYSRNDILLELPVGGHFCLLR